MKKGTTITDKALRALKPTRDHYEVSDDKVAGLSFRVHPSGKKNFFVRYFANGRRRRFTLKPDYPALTLSEARERTREILYNVSKGEDPQAQKSAERKAETFNDLTDRYCKIHLPNLKLKTREFYELVIDKYLIKEFGHLKPIDIKRSDIIALLDDIAFVQKKPTMANRVKAVISSILSFGVDKGLLEFNQAKTIKPVKKERPRDRILSDEEILKVWIVIENESPVIRGLFKLLLLLGQRSGETKRMKWEQLHGDIWEISSEETKAGRRHIVPLPQLVIEELEYLKKYTGDSVFVFETPSNRTVGHIESIHKALDRIKEKSGVDFRIHDLRRTFASGLAKQGVDRTVIGKLLNHKSIARDFGVTAIYDRYDYLSEKRQAITTWAIYLQNIVSDNIPSDFLRRVV